MENILDFHVKFERIHPFQDDDVIIRTKLRKPEGGHPERIGATIYITGDTHGQFGRIEAFCERFGTSREDILIILGDAGINFGGWNRDCVKIAESFLQN